MTYKFSVAAGCNTNELLVSAYEASAEAIPGSVLTFGDPHLGMLGAAYSGDGGSTVTFSFTLPDSNGAGTGLYQTVIFRKDPGGFSDECLVLYNVEQILTDGGVSTCLSYEVLQTGF